MREILYYTLSMWLGVVGALIGITGKGLEIAGGYIKEFGNQIIDHSFRYDRYL